MKANAVITGASSGIGLALARNLSKKGYGLLLVARRESRLNEIAQELGNCHVFVADLSVDSECERLEKFLETYDFEIFINNAGFGECGKFNAIPLKREFSMIALNIFALHRFTKTASQLLEKKGGGYILNVASTAGLLPAGPYMATYYATKAYAASFTQAIANELENSKSKVSVSCLCPGPVDTEFNQEAHVEFALPGITAEFCANYALKQMFRRKKVIVPGQILRIGLFFGCFLPRNLLVKIAGKQQKRKIADSLLKNTD